MSQLLSASKRPDTDSILRFLRSQNPLRPSAAGDGKESVTSAGTGLHPSDRLAVSKFLAHREHVDTAVKERDVANTTLAKDGDKDATSLAQQVGKPYHSSDIIKRLRHLNPNLVFEQSLAFPDIMGIYWPDDRAEVRNGLRIRHILGFEAGYSPEFTVYHKDTRSPKKITRGWRSMLILLASKGYINFTAACRVFQVEGIANSAKWKAEVDHLKRV